VVEALLAAYEEFGSSTAILDLLVGSLGHSVADMGQLLASFPLCAEPGQIMVFAFRALDAIRVALEAPKVREAAAVSLSALGQMMPHCSSETKVAIRQEVTKVFGGNLWRQFRVVFPREYEEVMDEPLDAALNGGLEDADGSCS